MSEKRDGYIAAQKRLIATLLYDSETINRVLEIVTPEDIEEPNLELIYTAMLNLARRNEHVSSVTVAKELEETGTLKAAGGTTELYSLIEYGRKVILEAQPPIYADIVKKSSTRTKVSRILSESMQIFKENSGISVSDGVSTVLTDLNNELHGLSDDATSIEVRESLANYAELLAERKRLSELNAEVSNGLQGIPSLLPSMNDYTTGWLPGQLITLGARTGIGKSVFAINSAVAAASAGKSVLFFSLEMGENEIMDRITSSVTGIPMDKLKKGDLTQQDRDRLNEKAKEIARMKILIDTDPKETIDSIRAKALRRAQSPEGLDFIIIDYLQLITPVGRFSNRQEAVADMSRNMKLLAKQLEVPIMVLVQVNRESKDDENSIPQLSQIRESGAIAQDSDIVILLHRESSMDDTIPHTLVLLAKNRNGQADKMIRCHSNLECSLFREITRSKDIPRMTEEEMDELSDDLDLSEFDDDVDLSDL